MAYIFLDESGDLGFNWSKKKTSKYFLITFLFCQSKRPFEKAVSKTHQELKKRHKAQRSVLHAYQEDSITRKRLLKKLTQKNCKIMVVYLDKRRVYTKLQNEKTVLYNYVTNILIDRVIRGRLIPLDKKVQLIASRRETSKFLNLNFTNYLQQQIKNNHKVEFDVSIKRPHEEKVLQVVDFVSWAIFRRYEHDDDSYYNFIKNCIVEENPLLS